MKSDGKFCVLCGKELPTPKERGGKRLYCDVCKKEIKRMRDRTSAEKKKALETDAEERQNSLTKLVREAHSLNLTYGRYVAMRTAGTLERYCKDHGLKMPK